MTVERASLWDFEPPLNSEESLVLCPECVSYLPLKDWDEAEVACEDCGEHPAMMCPACGGVFDHVHSDAFETAEPAPEENQGR